jgi:galactonate dehydratase
LSPRPHCACHLLQIDGCTYNAVIQEQSLGIHYNVGNDLLDYLTDPSVSTMRKAPSPSPTGPGLGIDVNEDYVHADGSIAEW